MAKKSHKRRKNPTLLVNPRKGKHSRRKSGHKRHASRRGNPRKMSFARLFGRRKSRRKNPILANPRHRRSKTKTKGRRKNPVMVNPRHRARTKNGRFRKNPIMVNPRKRAKARGKRKNPISINPRRNPYSGPGSKYVSGFLGKIQKMVAGFPLVGKLLAAAIGGVGAALGGAIGVVPTAYLMPRVSRYIPAWLRPYGYTVAGSALGAALEALGRFTKMPVLGQVGRLTAAGGGAVDAYRAIHGKSQDLGDGDMGDETDGNYAGEDSEFSGEAFDTQYGDAYLSDISFCGDDLSEAELGVAELGASHWQKKYPRRKMPDGGLDPRSEEGHRWGWLIQWIGHDNFAQLAKKSPDERRSMIAHAKKEAHIRMQALLSQGVEPSMAEGVTAGLLVAA